MGMSRMLSVPEELAAEMTPGVRAFVETLLGRIAELEARLQKTPHNSSLPPSTQHPHAKPAPAKPTSGRKLGGQPGHARHKRALIPTEQCHEMVWCKPTRCRRCAHTLTGDDSQPLRHQVWELPEIKPIVTQYQRHRLTCPWCGETTCGELPDGVPQSQAGPRWWR